MGLATSIPGFSITTNPSSGGGGSLPSWVPNAGQFANVSLNLARDVDPCPGGGCAWSEGGMENTFAAWNGGVYCPNYSTYGGLAWFGGGHAAYSGNEVDMYDITSRLFKRIGFPSPYSEIPHMDSNGEFPDGQPMLQHQYDGIVYIPPTFDADPLGSVLKVDNAGSGPGVRWIHRMPLSTGPDTGGAWNRYCNRSAAGNGSAGYVGSTWDPTRNRVWMLGGANSWEKGFSYLIPSGTAGTLTVLSFQGSNADTEQSVEYCPQHDMLVQYGEFNTFSGLAGRLCTAPSSVFFERMTMSGGGPNFRMGFRWPTALNKFVSYAGNGSNAVWTLTPPATNPLTGTWNWASQTLSGVGGAIPALANATFNGTWSRFSEVPSLCDATRATFVYVDGRNNPAQLWCLPRP